eukprot:2535291-Pleurochrysis_carterae.AAC.1
MDRALLSVYQSLVGALLSCSLQTCPDVDCAVGMLCRAMSSSNDELLATARRVFMYLCTSPITDPWGCVSRAARHQRYRASQTRNGRRGIERQKQPSVAISAYEAEIIAASEATKEAVYLLTHFDDLGRLSASEPTHVLTGQQVGRRPCNSYAHQIEQLNTI